MSNKTEIYILAGFLGSGKTTLLRQVLEYEKKEGRKIAVLMNELGDISIDSDSVGEGVPLKELLGGCICCTIQDKLEAQIQGLLAEHCPDAIYIETTGAAHPVEVLDAVLSPFFAGKIEMKGILTTVDGTLWASRTNFNPQIQQLLLEQVRHADLILINKSDQLSDMEQGRVTMEIQNINQKAPCILTAFSKVSMDQVKNLSSSAKGEVKGAHVNHQLRLGTFVHQFKNSVRQEDFEDFLRALPDDIYRIKGYVKFQHSSFPDLFQYSYGTPLYMKEYMNMPLNLVFIGQGINWDQIESQLQRLENGGQAGSE
ncbi:cobalamin biosynthesis protein [Mesobacillus campisalis]|uniref:Cobalamin biosynthesis protein n=1 Tax=Mesobacillus campisalis TaxID=1408103 RepID=A0A0M2SWB8_9BACI|nr:GTP-binding protein [Mesobacillus campisalis]KKK37267.1 cobalamin biosynthesis protein [Mesobacillus campisalis]